MVFLSTFTIGGSMIKKIAFIGIALALFAIVGCGDKTPLAPTNLIISSMAPITLSWDYEAAATSYNIYRGTISGNLSTKTLLASNVYNGNSSPLTSYTDTSTTVVGTTYYYQITAVNWDRESSPSNEVHVTP